MNKTIFVTRLYTFYLLFIMVSCNHPKITVLSNCAVPSHPGANSISFSEGEIIDIGNNLPGDIIINLNGGFVYPGFSDSHMHLVGYGKSLEKLDLVGTNSILEIKNLVSSSYDKSNKWIEGRGWDQNDWENIDYPTKEDLDLVAGDQPVYLRRIDGHAAWVNSKVLSICGINDKTKDPEGGKIIRDKNGSPTGIFIDNAIDLIEKFLPQDSSLDKKRYIERAVKSLNKFGLTSIHDAGTDIETIKILKKLIQQDKLSIRVNAMLNNHINDYNFYINNGPERINDFLFINSIKIYFDGAMGSRGAYLLEPYSDDPDNVGLTITNEDHIRKKVKIFNEAGFQVAIHCIGDKANRIALDIFEEIGNKLSRNRIEHAQIIHADDINRFVELGVIPSMQSTHCTSDMYWVDERLGPERIHQAYPWNSLLNTGSIIPGGSDAPVEIPDPLMGIYAAVTRKDINDWPKNGWLPDERMTIDQAISSITEWSAYSMFAEKFYGKIDKGYLADFTVLNNNLSKIDSNNIPEVKVLYTFVNGEIVYQDDK
ncbi:MAG: amidohydrolase [Candidatus Neomarinimicrobiota bacterium]|nr:amidohydrolase [Candidatus Neomarinimicrobiota bacterium]